LTLQGEKTRDGKDEIRDKKLFPRQGKKISSAEKKFFIVM